MTIQLETYIPLRACFKSLVHISNESSRKALRVWH